MLLSQKIVAVLQIYKQRRGVWRRLFSVFGFGYAPAIKALRQLDLDKVDEFQILKCFIDNMPKESQLSYKVYDCIFSFIEIREVTRCLKILNQSKCLTKENFNAVKKHPYPLALASALSELNEVLLTQENFNAIKEHPNPFVLASALSELNKVLLTQENFNVIKEHDDPRALTSALSELNEVLLTQENFNAIKEHDEPLALASALSELNEVLLTQENFNAIKEHPNPFVLASALSELNKAKLFTQENFNAIKEDNYPLSLVSVLFKLNKAKILTQENRDFIKEHPYSLALASILSELNKAKLLTQENRDVIKKHSNPRALAKVLIVFNRIQLLTLENFGRLIHSQNDILLTLRIDRANTIWDCLPPHLLTQGVFEELIRRASLPNPTTQIQQYINLLLHNNNAVINNNQSTHTASIHHSVSTSAIKLWIRYGKELPENKIKKIITIIKKDIANLSDTLIDKAAKNCIERITKDDYIFTDSKSTVTLEQLLALFYLAINDHETRLGSLEDAKKQFVMGLYEIQRGYNLSARGLDDKQEDRPICTAGTFNKLMEKLSGIHPDVELLFLTKETATLKLPITVREEVKNYLEKLSKPETKEGLHYFIMLLEQLLKDGIDIIWNKIKPKVTDRLFDEFKSIYQDNKENPDFLNLVDAGQYTQIENFGDYQQQIVSSAGYRKYCSQTLQHNGHLLPRNSIFFSKTQNESVDDAGEKVQSLKSRGSR